MIGQTSPQLSFDRCQRKISPQAETVGAAEKLWNTLKSFQAIAKVVKRSVINSP